MKKIAPVAKDAFYVNEKFQEQSMNSGVSMATDSANSNVSMNSLQSKGNAN